MPQPHNFAIGDNITVLDYHTTVAPMAWPTTYYIVGFDGDYFLARRRSFTDSRIHTISKYYPHIVRG
jgi:hypothetical protein